MMETTYALTLVNDYPFYTAVRKELYMEVFTIANILHDAYHSDEGLTMVDRYSAIVTAIEKIQENT
jgi:hypothetical protein